MRLRLVFPKNRAALLLLAGFVWFPREVVAQEQIPAARELISIAVRPDFDYTKLGRAKFVRLLSAYCREILRRLPTNTPSEDAWVASEGKTSDMAKVRRLTSSREFSRKELKDTFSACEQTTDKLIKPDGLSVAYEAANLVSLSVTFNNDGDIAIYAPKAEVNPKELGFDFLPSVRRSLLVAALSLTAS
jgi:hypothetical protein